MPRPKIPSRLHPIEFLPTKDDVTSARLDARSRVEIAQTLGLPNLTDQQAIGLSEAIAIYRKTKGGNRETSVGASRRALTRLIKTCDKTVHEMRRVATTNDRRSANKRLRCATKNTKRIFQDITSDDSGMPYEINEALRPHAARCLPALSQLFSKNRTYHGELVGAARETVSLLEAARAEALVQRDSLSQLGQARIHPQRDSFRLFCGVLRKFFESQAVSDIERPCLECCRFILAVLAVAEIEHDFESHPDRLYEAMRTDMSLPT